MQAEWEAQSYSQEVECVRVCACEQLTLCRGAHVGESVLIALTITVDCLVGLRERGQIRFLLHSSTHQMITVLIGSRITQRHLMLTFCRTCTNTADTHLSFARSPTVHRDNDSCV